MDVILEIFDTFLFDRLYAEALPASPPYSITVGDGVNAANVSLGKTVGYIYTPSTSYFTLEPSKYAYMSSWPRDYVYRQGFTLYLITWYENLDLHSDFF
jgi:lathosterol oxidase